MPSSEDSATLTAYLFGVDHAAREAEAKWGIDRLPTLIPADLRAKFERQRLRWSEATEAAWTTPMLTTAQLEAVIATSAAMERAWQALDRAAEEAGHRPIIADVMEARLADGSVIAVVRTNAEAGKVIADGRHVHVFTMTEIANLIDALPELLLKAKQTFPGVKVSKRIGGPLSADAGLPVPF